MPALPSAVNPTKKNMVVVVVVNVVRGSQCVWLNCVEGQEGVGDVHEFFFLNKKTKKNTTTWRRQCHGGGCSGHGGDNSCRVLGLHARGWMTGQLINCKEEKKKKKSAAVPYATLQHRPRVGSSVTVLTAAPQNDNEIPPRVNASLPKQTCQAMHARMHLGGA